MEWDALCLQEFSGRKGGPPTNPWLSNEGHLIFQQAPAEGRKICAVIVNAKHGLRINKGSFSSLGRHCSVDVVVAGLRLRLISAHLDPGHIDPRELYWNDIEELDSTIITAPKNFTPILGMDANATVGVREDSDTAGIIGEFADGPMCTKGEMLATLCSIHRIRLVNIYHTDKMGHYTCFHHGRRPANQIDFIGTTFSNRRVIECATVESSATVSDHKPLLLSLPCG